jgi:hypothetical protein
MLSFSGNLRVYLAVEPCDTRTFREPEPVALHPPPVGGAVNGVTAIRSRKNSAISKT